MSIKFGVLVSFLFLLNSCATVRTEGVQSSVGNDLNVVNALPAYPPFQGSPARVQVMKFSLPKEIAEQYPELREKQVGWGLYNRLIDELYQSGRFSLIEEKADMQKKLMEQWILSESGIVAQDQQIKVGELSMAQYLVYAELVDFSVSKSSAVVGVSTEQRATTRIGLQIRLLDLATGEYIPASGLGEATTLAQSTWLSPQMSFDQSTVGLATARASRLATLQLISRMK